MKKFGFVVFVCMILTGCRLDLKNNTTRKPCDFIQDSINTPNDSTLFLFQDIDITKSGEHIIEKVFLDTSNQKTDTLSYYTFHNDSSSIAYHKINGQLEGNYYIFYPSCKLKTKGSYAKGKHNGKIFWHSEDGDTLETKYYWEGNLYKEQIQYHPNSDQIARYAYHKHQGNQKYCSTYDVQGNLLCEVGILVNIIYLASPSCSDSVSFMVNIIRPPHYENINVNIWYVLNNMDTVRSYKYLNDTIRSKKYKAGPSFKHQFAPNEFMRDCSSDSMVIKFDYLTNENADQIWTVRDSARLLIKY